jgi:hypothetical protein
MSGELRMNLGALHSAMQLTLHTHHAARIWHGRPALPKAPRDHRPEFESRTERR